MVQYYHRSAVDLTRCSEKAQLLLQHVAPDPTILWQEIDCKILYYLLNTSSTSVYIGKQCSLTIKRYVAIGIDYRGQPGHAPQIIEKRLCSYQFLPHFSPPKFGFPLQYF